MLDFPLFSFNGALCAAAFGFAAFVRPGRRKAMTLAACLLMNFLVCAFEYTDWPLRHALQTVGLPVTAPDVWLVADTLFGCTALLVGFEYRWAQSLWALACGQIVAHLSYQMQLFDQYVYSDTLQVVLLAQLAVFFVIGGPRAWDHLRSCLDRFCRSGRPVAARTGDASERYGE